MVGRTTKSAGRGALDAMREKGFERVVKTRRDDGLTRCGTQRECNAAQVGRRVVEVVVVEVVVVEWC